MVKMLLLQGWYGLSDYEAERQANDRISFRHFLGYPETIPDRSTPKEREEVHHVLIGSFFCLKRITRSPNSAHKLVVEKLDFDIESIFVMMIGICRYPAYRDRGFIIRLVIVGRDINTRRKEGNYKNRPIWGWFLR